MKGARQADEKTVRAIFLFYGAMIAVGLGLTLWRHDSLQIDPLQFPGLSPLPHLLTTAAVILLVCGGSRLWIARSPRARRCADMALRVLGALRRRDILWLALLSGVGEELLFRGWLLHETGLWFSSILFGMIHVPPNRDWWFWPVFATAMGLVFGLLTLSSGTIVWAVLAHIGINYLNLNHALSERKKKSMELPTT